MTTLNLRTKKQTKNNYKKEIDNLNNKMIELNRNLKVTQIDCYKVSILKNIKSIYSEIDRLNNLVINLENEIDFIENIAI